MPGRPRPRPKRAQIGCNIEDQIVGGDGLYAIEHQAARLAAIRAAVGDAFFINARTDVFLQAAPDAHAGLVDAALDRAKAYAGAGASGVFVPGLADAALIAKFTAASPLPVNIMASPATPPADRLAALGVARISHGAGPYRVAMHALADAAKAIYGVG